MRTYQRNWLQLESSCAVWRKCERGHWWGASRGRWALKYWWFSEHLKKQNKTEDMLKYWGYFKSAQNLHLDKLNLRIWLQNRCSGGKNRNDPLEAPKRNTSGLPPVGWNQEHFIAAKLATNSNPVKKNNLMIEKSNFTKINIKEDARLS